MSNSDVLSTALLADGRKAELSHVAVGDAAAVLGYVEAIAGETDYLSFGPGEFGLSLEEEVAFIASLADRSKGLMLKATVGDMVVGMAGLSRSPRPRVRHVGVMGLSVRKALWGVGVGRALCQALFAEARAIGIWRIELRVRADNERAIRLYKSLGFTLEGRLAGAFRVGDTEYDELAMRLKLSGGQSATTEPLVPH